MNQKHFFDLAEQMEKSCEGWEQEEGMSPEARAKLIAAVEALDKKSKVRHFPMKKRYLVVFAAALVLLMGLGVAGDRAWIAGSSELERETEVTTKVDNDEKSDILLEEEAIYQDIAEKLGIVPLRLGWIPDGMELDNYQIMEDTGWAGIYYIYQERVVYIQMFKESIESSSNVQWDGDAYELEKIFNDSGYEECMEAYCIDPENQNYGASINYGNGYYSIFGSFSDETEFLSILKGIYFK